MKIDLEKCADSDALVANETDDSAEEDDCVTQDGNNYFENNSTLKELISSCKDLVAYFKRVGHVPGMTSLKQEVDLRWNSKLLMMKSIVKEKANIQSYLSAKSEMNRLEKINFDLIESLCDFLEPFKLCVDSLEGSKYVTLHSVLLLKKKLLGHLQVQPNENYVVSQLKETATSLLEKKWPVYMIHKVATFLCPKFKNLSFLEVAEKQEVHAHVRQIICDIEKCSDAANASHTPCVENEHSYDMLKVMHPKKSFTSDMSEFEDDIISSNKQAPTDEVTIYLNSSFHEDYVAGLSDENVVGGLNLLLFWKAKANQFPSLSALAKCVLCIPASSASSERAFSTSGRVFKERRTRLGSDTLDAILALHSFNKSSVSVS